MPGRTQALMKGAPKTCENFFGFTGKNPPKRNKLRSPIPTPHSVHLRRKLAFDINLSLPSSFWASPARSLGSVCTLLLHKARCAPLPHSRNLVFLLWPWSIRPGLARFGRVQQSYLCLTKTVTWYIATYSLCGWTIGIQSEQGSRRETSGAPTPVKELNRAQSTTTLMLYTHVQ